MEREQHNALTHFGALQSLVRSVDVCFVDDLRWDLLPRGRGRGLGHPTTAAALCINFNTDGSPFAMGRTHITHA